MKFRPEKGNGHPEDEATKRREEQTAIRQKFLSISAKHAETMKILRAAQERLEAREKAEQDAARRRPSKEGGQGDKKE